jgi:hypothetical protein
MGITEDTCRTHRCLETTAASRNHRYLHARRNHRCLETTAACRNHRYLHARRNHRYLET